MKKILTLLIFLLFVSFVSAALNIQETNINATVDPGTVFSKQITLENSENVALDVSFSGLELSCLTDGSKKISAVVSDLTVPANSTVPVSILFSVPANQLACTYHGNIIASAGALMDAVTADITVNPVPSISVANKTITILKNLSTLSTLNVALTNNGNTELNLIYQYSNFTRAGSVLALGSAGSKVIPLGDTQHIPINIATDNTLPDGDYTSTLTINGTVNEKHTLTATLKTPVLSVSLPSFTLPESDRNETVTGIFKIKNDGDYPLEGISLITDAPSEYQVSISGVPNSLSSGQEATVTISAFIPEDERTTVHTIGNLFFDSNRISETLPLKVDVKTKLQIDEVDVKVGGSSNRMDSDGGIIDDEDTLPGSEFSVEVKMCNAYTDEDFEITDITGTVTFENVDDGYDIEGEIEEFDLDGGDCETVKVSFDSEPRIHYLTDEGVYDMIIEIEGDDEEFGISQEDEWAISVEVFRDENTNIILDEVRLAPSTVQCGGSADLEVVAYNIGERDRDGKLTIRSSSIDLDITRFFEIGDDIDEDCDAIEEPDEECIGIDHIFRIPIPSNAPAGNHFIETVVYRDETRETDSETVQFTVNCGTSGTGGDTTGDTGADDSTGDTGTGSGGNVIVTPTPDSSGSTVSGTPVRIKDLSGSSDALWTIGLIAGIVIVALIIVLVVMSLTGRKVA